MPVAEVRGVHISYEVLGASGPWVALTPGGRQGMDGVRPLGNLIAAAGYRVLLHDRRNCGASDVVIDGDDAEYVIAADDLHALLGQLGALPAFIGGGSAGCRTSLHLALRHPEAVRGLLLWYVSGGSFAAEGLAYQYYTQYMEMAEKGGMAAVCASEHFAACIQANPSNRDRLMAMDPQRFIQVMENWRGYFLRSADQAATGLDEADLRSITMPAVVVPGNDQTHVRAVGERAAGLMPNAELHVLITADPDPNAVPGAALAAVLPEVASLYIDLMRRVDAAVAPH